MRLSRKAALMANGIRWRKFNCTARYQSGYESSQTGWELVTRGSATGASFSGYTSYSIETTGSGSGTSFAYVGTGSRITISSSNPGTVYQPNGSTIIRYRITGDTFDTYTNSVSAKFVSWYTYIVGDEIGYVRAAKDEYPDANIGYTYVSMSHQADGQYLIMKKSNAEYYAYLSTATTGNVPSYTNVATIQDDVLFTTGNVGDSGVVNGEAALLGSNTATIEDDILYVG